MFIADLLGDVMLARLRCDEQLRKDLEGLYFRLMALIGIKPGFILLLFSAGDLDRIHPSKLKPAYRSATLTDGILCSLSGST